MIREAYIGAIEQQGLLRGKRVCMVAPFAPRKGGVTVQTELLVECLRNEGVEVLRVDTNLQKLRIPKIGTPIRLLLQPWAILFRLLAQLPRADVVQVQAAVNWGFLPALIAVPICKLFNRRCVVVFHSGLGPKFVDRFPWIVKPVLRMADRCAVVSPVLQQAFSDRGIRAEFVRNLFDPQLFLFRKRSFPQPRIVWTRGFSDIYDPVTAIDAFELIQRSYPNATMVMAGNGPMLNQVKQLIEARGISGIDLPGRLSLKQIAEAIDDADIFLNTSKQDGMPTSLLEAAASGIPIVTTNAGGIASLFRDKQEAVFARVGDAEALAEGVVSLISNPRAAFTMAAYAKVVAEEYEWPGPLRTLTDVYGFGEDGAVERRMAIPATLLRGVTNAARSLLMTLAATAWTWYD